jgi:hypothetical protein
MQRVSQSVRLPFDAWRPDLPFTDVQAVEVATNVTPGILAYEPFRELTPISANGTDTTPVGAISAHKDDGPVAIYVGDTGKLYELEADGTLDDISRTAGYSTATRDIWSFAQFGSLVIATNFSDEPQKINIATASVTAANLGGSPPRAKYVSTVRDFVVMGHLSTDPKAIRWSQINDAESWTIGTNQADTQVFPDGGWVQGLAGGEVLYVFQERAIRRMSYVGAPLIFEFDEISRNRGCVAGQSLVQVGSKIFFLAEDGFFMLENDQLVPIGHEKVDDTFFEDFENAYRERITAAADPVKKIVIWAYPSKASTGNPDKIIVYNWASDRWSLVDYTITGAFTFQNLGYTLEGLDALSASLDALGVSLDDPALQSTGLALAAFDANNRLGLFTGNSLEATIETKEFSSPAGGVRSNLKEVIPIADSTLATVQIGTRERVGDSVVWTDASSQAASGVIPTRANGRFFRVRLTIPAPSGDETTAFTRAQGVEVHFSPQGRR